MEEFERKRQVKEIMQTLREYDVNLRELCGMFAGVVIKLENDYNEVVELENLIKFIRKKNG